MVAGSGTADNDFLHWGDADIMLGRLGHPEEIAATVLLSEDASFITGTVMAPDGGETAV